MNPLFYFGVYLAVINTLAILITISDKIKAIHHKRRISENTLIFVSLVGGSVCMLFTMLIIHHKTRKLKFMLGIPIIIAVQTVSVLLVMNYAV